MLAGGTLPERTIFFALDSVGDLEFAVRRGAWKLLLDRQRNSRELYNLADDPLEMFNLIDTERNLAAMLAREAAAAFASIGNDTLRPH
jgi:arylsulfatase A-like enzyme